MRTLIIPDSHADSSVPNTRYHALGEYIAFTKPDVVVELGDFADIPALCSYDYGSGAHEGKRLKQDLSAAQEARGLLTLPIQREMKKSVENHKKRYRPKLIALSGNHEYRIVKTMNQTPSLIGMFDEDVSQAAKWGWEWHPFGEIVTVGSIDYCHYFTSGIMGRPIGGVNLAYSLIQKRYRSSVQGHTHVWDYKTTRTDIGMQLIGLSAGCFFDHKQDYAKNANNMWWAGVTELIEGKQGVEVRQISLERIMEWAKRKGHLGGGV